jgi:hypothetical protein
MDPFAQDPIDYEQENKNNDIKDRNKAVGPSEAAHLSLY